MCSASPTLSKPSRRAVRGQQLFQIDLDPEQVAHGVLVLDPVEPAQHDPPLGGPRVRFGGGHARGDPVGQRLDLLLRRTRLLLRRHLPLLEPLDHGGPTPCAGARPQSPASDVVQPEIPLGLLAAVTIHAVPRQQRPELLVERFVVARLVAVWGGAATETSPASVNPRPAHNPPTGATRP